MRPGVNGTGDIETGIVRSLLDACATGQNDQVSKRDFLAARLGAVELVLDALQSFERLRQLGGLVDCPVLLRRQANAGAVGAAALVGATERGCRRPGGRNQFRDRQAGSQDLTLERGDVLIVNQLVIDRGDRVLPDEFFRRNFRAEITRARAHVAVRQLEPRPGEGVGELIGILQEAPRDLFVSRVEPQGEVRGQHGGRDSLRGVVRMRHGAGASAVLRLPLMRAGRALREFPLVAEQVLEVVVAPLRRRRGPGDFQAAGDRVSALAGAEFVRPAQALLVDARPLRAPAPRLDSAAAPWVLPKVWPPAMSATVSSSFIAMRLKVSRISRAAAIGSGLPFGPSRVDVNQPHLHGSQADSRDPGRRSSACRASHCVFAAPQ